MCSVTFSFPPQVESKKRKIIILFFLFRIFFYLSFFFLLWYQNRCQVSFFFMLALYRSLKFSDFDNISLKLMRMLWRKMHPWCVLEQPGVHLELLGPLQLPFKPHGASSLGPFSSIMTHSSTDDLVQKPPHLRPDKKIYVPGYTTSTVVCSYPSILWSSREVLSNYKLLRKYRKKQALQCFQTCRNVVTV